MSRSPLQQYVTILKSQYGKQKPPMLGGPWEMILWENVAYLVDVDRRRQAFDVLEKRVGTDPKRILKASDRVLLEVTRHGIVPETFVTKLRDCAQLAIDEFDGDVAKALALPIAKAKKALRKFPGIGEPGAEKILLFTRTHPILALESNGLRVLVRLGYGEEKKNYAATYRLVQDSIQGELKKDFGWLIQAHLLLRRHGQELCRRSKPRCDQCTLAASCAYFVRRTAHDIANGD